MNGKLDMRFSEAEKTEFKRRAEVMGRHFTPEEREQMRRRAERPGLIGQERGAMDLGIPPPDPRRCSKWADVGMRW